MQIKQEASLLRIFIGDADKISNSPVYEKIVGEARKNGLAGATVFKGILSFGGSSIIHSAKMLSLAEDLPMVIEIVDETEKIKTFLPLLDRIFEEAGCGGLVTLEKAEVIRYHHDEKRKR